MAKKTNKTSHVLNLITGSQPPVPSSGETQPSAQASGETQQEGSAAEEPEAEEDGCVSPEDATGGCEPVIRFSTYEVLFVFFAILFLPETYDLFYLI